VSSAVPISVPQPENMARRRHPRYQLSVPFEMTVFRPGAAVRLSGRAQDLGEGGLRGVISGTALTGERVELTLRLPAATQPLRMRAVVRHERELQCGFEFLSLGQSQREELQRLPEVGDLGAKVINGAEWKPGMAPPPRSGVLLCPTCGSEFPEDSPLCESCGAGQDPAEEASEEKAVPSPFVKEREEASRPKTDAVLDSVVAIIFLMTLSVGLWQWLNSPVDSGSQGSSVTVELKNVFLRPKPSVAEEAKPRARSNPTLSAAKAVVSAVIGEATPAREEEAVGMPGSAASEPRRRSETVSETSRHRSAAPASAPTLPSPSPSAPASALPSPGLSAPASAASSPPPLSSEASAAGEAPSGSSLEGMLLQKVLPMYPARARKEGLQGQVVLKAVIAKDGTIADLRPLQGPQELSAAAIDAVQHWRFRPYQMNGKPVEVETDIRLNFQLPK
jgi:TonB family protein